MDERIRLQAAERQEQHGRLAPAGSNAGRHRALVRCPANSICWFAGPSDLIDTQEPGQSADPQTL